MFQKSLPFIILLAISSSKRNSGISGGVNTGGAELGGVTSS